MSFNYYKPSKSEFNDCIAKGVCSVPPTVSALKEVIVMLLRHLAYYIEKLNKNGVECDELKKELVSSLAEIFTTADYSDGEVYSSILKNYNNLIQTKEFYIQLCKDKNIPPQEIRGEVKISPDMNLARLISLGEQIFRARGKKLGNNHKQLFDILLLITRNFASNIITLESAGSIESKYIDKVYFLIAPETIEKIKCTACTVDNTIIFTITSVIENTNVETNIKQFLEEKGIKVIIEGNGI